jgi:hypothetical protein
VGHAHEGVGLPRCKVGAGVVHGKGGECGVYVGSRVGSFTRAAEAEAKRAAPSFNKMEPPAGASGL